MTCDQIIKRLEKIERELDRVLEDVMCLEGDDTAMFNAEAAISCATDMTANATRNLRESAP